MFTVAVGLSFYALYALFFLLGAALVIVGLIARRRRSPWVGFALIGLVLILIPLSLVLASFLDPP